MLSKSLFEQLKAIFGDFIQVDNNYSLSVKNCNKSLLTHKNDEKYMSIYTNRTNEMYISNYWFSSISIKYSNRIGYYISFNNNKKDIPIKFHNVLQWIENYKMLYNRCIKLQKINAIKTNLNSIDKDFV